MSYSRNRAIAIAVCEGPMTTTQAAAHFQVSTRTVSRIAAAYRSGGLEALTPKTTRPHTNPNATPARIVEQILTLRHALARDGLDNGAQSIYNHLDPATRPSTTTIWRILRRHDQIINQPQKRPRSSWKRFEASLPNETWQSDFTHVRLANDTSVEVISWLDDHSRYLLHVSAHFRITGPIVIKTFLTTTNTYGLPASTLTDNGMVYTTRLAGGNKGERNQPNGFEQLLADLGITQKNGSPNHPTTQGKIERYHQTLKKWLQAHPPAANLKDLNQQLTTFQTIYNTKRPHRAINRQTPHTAYHAKPKAEPTITLGTHPYRVRLDTVNTNGTITMRYQGQLRHLGIGRGHKNKTIIALTHNNEVIIIEKTTGEIIAEHKIDPTKNYQPKRTKDAGHPPKKADK
ncbi:IS481 family transposase [Actinomyces sp.]|uniref:IS481 family transposase n=1 Tax=Actinomyces sp. TaxID=29317 RepID=UPI00291455A3|nr:IS481 family transposase [Actinomyces sp.]MDU6679414.1 IS481 family transposase [Actinomyces sp.]